MAVPADGPNDQRRSYLLQNPSDRMRDHARDFFKRLVALVPDTDYHERALVAVRELIEDGERSTRLSLEAREDFVVDGFKYKLPGDPELAVDVPDSEPEGEATTNAPDKQEVGQAATTSQESTREKKPSKKPVSTTE